MRIDPTHYRQTFFDEARDHLAALEAALLRLDATPGDTDAVAEAFRAAHSVKGAADAVGFPEVAGFTHALEGILDGFRKAPGPIPRRVLDLLLEALDVLGGLVVAAREGDPRPPGTEEMLGRLAALAVDPAPADPAASYTVTVVPHPDAFRAGLDPLTLIRELAGLGTDVSVRLNPGALPALADMDPERCYLSWVVRLRTDRPAAALADVFAFAPEMVRATIEPDGPAAGYAAGASLHLSRVESAVRRLPTPDPLRFASFLVGRGALTPAQALEALNLQREARPLLGTLAVQAGVMTVEKMFETFDRMQAGEGFGHTAVRLGHLSEAALGKLFLAQEQNTPPLATVISGAGWLSAAKLDDEVRAFRENAETTGRADAEYSLAGEPVAPLPPGTSILDENGAMVVEFCGEAAEHLEAADRHLLTIDADPANAEALNAVYRGFHTIKGVAGMLGLAAVQSLAHEAENLLNLARDRKIVLQGKALDLAFASTDALKRQVAGIRGLATDRRPIAPDPDLPRLLADLKAVAGGKEPARTPTATAPTPASPPPPPPLAATAPAADAHPESAPAARRAATDKETVRVDKDRLDKLINTIGELVIAQSMAQEEFDNLTRRTGGHSLALPELSKISRDLQELSLSLRMVPMQGTFQKMTRLVRDLSRKIGKPVELELHGEETELDKTVVDRLGDPLMHMVRNAIDHGLEPPAERVAAGKPGEGRVALRAYHQGGNVYIELSDDGKGLDRDRILKKAIEKGIVPEGAKLTDPEVYALIFEPGFSTAAAVTDVSGRGVGMDVVRRNVEALQGNILIRTEKGKGTTFTIRLPLTLAIMDGLMVGLAEDVYVLPILAVVESFRPRRADLHVIAGRGEVVSVRGETVPLLRLYRLLGRTARVADPCDGLVVLVEDQGKKTALLVDELLGQMQAVVKSLDANYRRVEGLAGATILGDGRVAMILDVHGLTRLNGQAGGWSPPAPATSGTFSGDIP